jgi:uncharacterized protein
MPKHKNFLKTSYNISGMHCASCELLIEQTLLKQKNIKIAQASTPQGEVNITYMGSRPSSNELNSLFEGSGYYFSDKQYTQSKQAGSQLKQNILDQYIVAAAVAAIFITVFFYLHKTGVSALSMVGEQSSLPGFFIFGILAGLSTCAALVGGILLSLSKQWGTSFRPHLMFYSGRIASYAFFGIVLGIVGSFFQISVVFSSLLTFVVAAIMAILGLQMLGVKSLQKLRLALPNSLSRSALTKTNSGSKYAPFLIGAATFFLPCGFTISVQALAITTGNPIHAGLMLLSFSLGSVLALLIISLSSMKMQANKQFSGIFFKVAGILVIFFALYNINTQLNALGLTSLSDLQLSPSTNSSNVARDGFAPITDGKQILKMGASSFAYQPNSFKVKAGIPVRWEVSDVGISGCTNAIVSRELFSGEFPLLKNQLNVKEFTPQKPGKYKFSCWMGMVSGVIEVVGEETANNEVVNSASLPTFESGSSGCGNCQNTGGCGGGCGGGGCRTF